jgi:hypothetical protein
LTFDDLEPVLIDLCDNETFILVDALDECASPSEVVAILERMRKGATKVRTLVTSRDEVDIQDLMVLYDTPRVQLEHHTDDISWDIRYYIDERLQREPKLHWFSSCTKYQVAEKLNQGSAGM